MATPGRTLALLRRKAISFSNTKFFILDECDKVLKEMDMRSDVQKLFKACPFEKQVMMFSATFTEEMRALCRKFMKKVFEITISKESKLTLDGLQQYFVEVEENQKNTKLSELLDALIFNQVIIFVNDTTRAAALDQLLKEHGFPSVCIHGHLA